MLTPCQQEFLDLVERECAENGLAISIFKIGVEIGGMSYNVAWEAFKKLQKEKLIRARRLTNRQGKPWAIKVTA